MGEIIGFVPVVCYSLLFEMVFNLSFTILHFGCFFDSFLGGKEEFV